MTVVVRIVLSGEQALSLGEKLTGKRRPATRKQVSDLAEEAVKHRLQPSHNERTEMRNYVCPKCHKPIGIEVPVCTKEPTL